MLNASPSSRQNPYYDVSKFWAFRLTNIIAVASCFFLFAILLIPIPYFQKDRRASFIDLDLNFNSHSHAIKSTVTKHPGNVVSVLYSTHNVDHVISGVTFGSGTVHRDGDYLARFVNAHYDERVKGRPFKVVIIDVYPYTFIFRKFLVDEDSDYLTVDHSLYALPVCETPDQIVELSLSDLMNSSQKNIYKTQFHANDGITVMHFQGINCRTIGKFCIGTIEISFGENAISRTVTVVTNTRYDVHQIIVTTFVENESRPLKLVFYKTESAPQWTFRSVDAMAKATGLDIGRDTFKVRLYGRPPRNPVYFAKGGPKDHRLLIVELKHPLYRYQIVTGNYMNTILKLGFDGQTSDDVDNLEGIIDSLIVLEYSVSEPKPPTYYLFRRSRYCYTTSVIK